jgi:trigger factor
MQNPRELFTEEAQRRVGLGLLVAEVVRQNGILVDQQRVQQSIAEFASAYEDPAAVVRFYNSDRQQRATLENLVLEDQVVDWVLTQAQVEEVMTSFQDVTQGEGDA